MPDAQDLLRAVVAADVVTTDLEPAGQRPGADRGDPQVSKVVVSRDPLSGTEVGIWTCTPGGWPVNQRPNTEVAHILQGRARITDEDGQEREVGAGDVLVLPVGWTGRWEILEDLRKVYTITERV